jgi:hypothetical protein
MSSDERVLHKRKRPKETSFKAKTARVPFLDDKPIKVLSIPLIMDHYNYNIRAVDEFDHLTT